MNSTEPNPRVLSSLIILMALLDGFLHLMLDFILFHGDFIGGGPPPGPPPGAPPMPAGPPPGGPVLLLPFTLNVQFLLNFIGYCVLALAFWLAPRFLGRKRWALDVVMIFYAAFSIVAWWVIGMPNPDDLGFLSKGMEIVLIIALIKHIYRVVTEPARWPSISPRTTGPGV